MTKSKAFGELVYVYPAGRLEQNPEYLLRTAREKLESFSSIDYLLLSGDTTALSVASIIAAQSLGDGERTLRLLVWDSRFRKYFSTEFEVWEPETTKS